MANSLWWFRTSLFALGTTMVAQSQPNVTYKIYLLGTLGGTVSAGNSINNVAWIGGEANLSGDQSTHATLWVNNAKVDLGTLGGPNSGIIFSSKNDRGELVGVAETADVNPLGEAWSCSAFFPTVTYHNCEAFVWKNRVMTPLPTLGGYNGFGSSANNSGYVAGWAENSVHDSTCSAAGTQVLQFEAVIWGPDGHPQELPPYAGDVDGAATSINNLGQVVGISGTCDVAVGEFSAAHALLWADGRVYNLGNLGGVAWNTPTAINDRGQIAGFSDLPGDQDGTPNFHAFLWTKATGIQDLGTLGTDTMSEATGINNKGQIVGVSYPSGHAFIWENGSMTDLNSLLAPGSNVMLVSTGDINDEGEITGQACVVSNGACTTGSQAFLAVPVPNVAAAPAPHLNVPPTTNKWPFPR